MARTPSMLPYLTSRLRATIATAPEGRLQSSAILAKMLGVSRPTVLKALHILRDEGTVTVFRGSRARKGPVSDPRMPDGKDAADRVYDILVARIQSGEYRASSAIPSVKLLVRECRVSPSTLRTACLRLENNGFLHRSGRQWIAGRQRTRLSGQVSSFTQEILVLHHSEVSWTRMQAARTRDFYREFVGCAERRGVRLTTIFLHDRFGPRYGLPSGIRNIVRYARNLGNRYLGTLAPLDATELTNIIPTLAALKRPLVWFDRYDVRPATDVPNNVFRAHFSEKAGVRTALAHLYKRGHRQILYAHNDSTPWMSHRGRLLEQISTASYSDLHIEHRISPFAAIEPSSVKHLAAIINRCCGDHAPWIRKLVESYLGRHPVSAREYLKIAGRMLMENRDHARFLTWHEVIGRPLIGGRFTALVAPSDKQGRIYREWLHRAGYRIPQDLSLISFDHSDDAHPYLLTTVDFGFGSLGYQACQVFLEDSPVAHDGSGNIGARAFVVDNGTVAWR